MMNAHMIAMMMFYGRWDPMMGGREPRGHPELNPMVKKCLQCGEEHNHNNCFCSAKCCGAHRKAEREGRVNDQEMVA